MTTFHLQADALDESFLVKLKSLFAHKEIDIVVRESAANAAGRADGISRLLAHPVGLKNFQSPSKEEIYSCIAFFRDYDERDSIYDSY